jgi:hypothetical protein
MVDGSIGQFTTMQQNHETSKESDPAESLPDPHDSTQFDRLRGMTDQGPLADPWQFSVFLTALASKEADL